MESVVVFVQGNIRFIESEYVYTLRDLKHITDGHSDQAISEEQIDQYATRIQELIDNPVKTGSEHVKEIKETQKEIKEGICPRCGGPLVLRTAKSTGRQFWGCSKYPKCKFTKKISE